MRRSREEEKREAQEDRSRQGGAFPITEPMVDAAAQEICESGITPYPSYPRDFRLVARQILEAAATAASPVSPLKRSAIQSPKRLRRW